MREFVKKKAEQHALSCYPYESAGIIVAVGGKQQYIPCTNQSSTPKDNFKISAEHLAMAEDMGPIVGIVHSHINILPQPSEADIASCEHHGVPWHIVAIWKEPGDTDQYVHSWNSFKPTGFVYPLVGRSFHHGVLDCYTLVRDFYDREMGISLPDFYREDNWWDNPDSGELYMDNFKQAGFVEVNDGPVYGDGILMQYRSNKVNHGGVYIGDISLKSQPGLFPVSGALLHHPMPRLSERVVYGGYWRDITRVVVRHKSVI